MFQHITHQQSAKHAIVAAATSKYAMAYYRYRSRFNYDQRIAEDRWAGFLIARIFYMVPASVLYLLVHIWRRLLRWHYCGVARSWSAIEATVTGSYQVDENEVIFSMNSWGEEDTGFETSNDYTARWAVAIQYSYQADGDYYAGTYFLPRTYADGDLADDTAKEWIGKTITVRYKSSNPQKSFFLEQDGAPGKPHIPRLLRWKPYVTELSLK